MKKIIFVLLFTIPLMECSSQKKESPASPIVGYWERAGDYYAGMVIKVEQMSSGRFISQILIPPDELANFVRPGDIYWQNVEAISKNRWNGTILVRNPVEIRGGFFSPKQTIAQAESAPMDAVMINKDTMEVYVNKQTQRWLRMPKEQVSQIFPTMED